MGLQIRRTGADEYGRFIKALICGDPGSGKTLTSSTWPNPIYASAEGGLMSVADRAIPYTEIKTSDDLQKLLQTLDQEASVREKMLKIPVDTVIVDTIDEIQRILIRERLTSGRKEHLAIQDYGWLGDQVRGIIRGFRNLPMHVVFTCHLKKSEDSEAGRIFMAPALQGAVGDEIAQYFDLALLLRGTVMTKVVNNQSERVQVKVMQTYPDPNYPWVKDRSGKLPAELELDFDSDFKQLFEAIYGDHEMEKSTEVVDVPDANLARQERIEQDLATQTGAQAAAAPAATQDAPAPPQPPAKAAAAKKAAKKATAKAAAPKAEAKKEPAEAEPAAEPAAEKSEEPEEKPAEPEAEKSTEAAQEAPQEPEAAPDPETAAAEPEASVEPEQGALEPAEVTDAEGETAGETQQELAAEPEVATPEAAEAEAPAEAEEGGALICEECGDPVENDDQADLSRIRFRKVLDRKCFVEAKKSK